MDNQGKSRELKHWDKDFKWFNGDTPIRKEFDEFCERWWGKNGKNKEPKEENWSSYSPHEEWKRMQLEIDINASHFASKLEPLNGLHVIGKKMDIATLETYPDLFVRTAQFAMKVMSVESRDDGWDGYSPVHEME
ncbi:hypothetical protein Tco_1012094 [Tanacetum coccineum]